MKSNSKDRDGVDSPGSGRTSRPYQARPQHRFAGGDDGDASSSQLPLYGALDLGTNNCRLLVARPSRRGFNVVDAFSRIIRLGEGVSATGRLSDAAMSRTLDALAVCANKLKPGRVRRSRLVATQACRIASNGAEFLDEVRRRTGLELEVLSREAEAKLAVSGCAALLDGQAELVLVFDIGGGSSEFIWLDLARQAQGFGRSIADRIEVQNCIAGWTSLPLGVVTLSEQFGGRDVTPAVFEAMVVHVEALLAPFEREGRYRERMRERRTHLLGTSGTVTTVAGIHLGLPRYDRSRVDGCWMRVADASAVTQNLLALSYEQRVAQPCIGRDRADLVLAGCAILEAVVRTWPCEHLRVADRGLREGILASLMAEDGYERGTRGRVEGGR
jgi:exopolyphosphatase / guanosine-5'-triphosphate,3'-diphosphate pyrophosphatase